jgi:hypothetical protein
MRSKKGLYFIHLILTLSLNGERECQYFSLAGIFSTSQ